MVGLIGFFEKYARISIFILLVISSMIFYISSLGFETSVPGPPWDIKAVLYHLIIFFLFGFFLMICLIRGRDKELFSLAVILSLGYAVLDEFHQIFVPNRSASIGDVLVDMVGVLFALLVYAIMIEIRKH